MALALAFDSVIPRPKMRVKDTLLQFCSELSEQAKILVLLFACCNLSKPVHLRSCLRQGEAKAQAGKSSHLLSYIPNLKSKAWERALCTPSIKIKFAGVASQVKLKSFGLSCRS